MYFLCSCSLIIVVHRGVPKWQPSSSSCFIIIIRLIILRVPLTFIHSYLLFFVLDNDKIRVKVFSHDYSSILDDVNNGTVFHYLKLDDPSYKLEITAFTRIYSDSFDNATWSNRSFLKLNASSSLPCMIMALPK